MTARNRNRMIKSTLEREIKLSVDSRFRLPKLPGRPLAPRILGSTYYDTADHRLARAGLTLRRRVEGRKSLWQLKWPAAGGRREVEVAGGPGIPPPQLRDLLLAHLRGDRLLPVATLRTRRAGIRVLGTMGPVADVVLDAVSVLKDRRVVQRFRELEIERLDGDDHLIGHLEHVLRKAGAESHDGRPKLFRALGLRHRRNPPPASDAPIAEQLAYLIGERVRRLLAHDPGTRLGGDIEDLHQMRVSARQLRALLRAARPMLDRQWADSLRAELAWLGGLLGPARDLDVQAAYFEEEAAAMKSRDRPPLERFIRHLSDKREALQKTLAEGLKSPRYLELIAGLIRASRKPAVVASEATLGEIASRAFRKLRKTMKRIGKSPTDAELHRVRIRTKRARYAGELALSSNGKPAARFLSRAKAFQDLLGTNQDAVLAEKQIRVFLRKNSGVRSAFAAGLLVERQRLRREAVRAVLSSRWRKLKKQGEKAWG
jgi:CHAD domain-containing protein